MTTTSATTSTGPKGFRWLYLILGIVLFVFGNNHLLRALVYVCTKGSKELTKMFLDSPLTIRKREDNE